MIDETCSGFANWDTFTVAVQIDNDRKLYRHVTLSTDGMTAEQATVWTRNDPTIAKMIRIEGVTKENVNWTEIGEHVVTP